MQKYVFISLLNALYCVFKTSATDVFIQSTSNKLTAHVNKTLDEINNTVKQTALLSLMDSDLSHSFSVLTARGGLSIGATLTSRPGLTMNLAGISVNVTASEQSAHTAKRSQFYLFCHDGCPLINEGGDCIHHWDRSLIKG